MYLRKVSQFDGIVWEVKCPHPQRRGERKLNETCIESWTINQDYDTLNIWSKNSYIVHKSKSLQELRLGKL